jgi:hypothetical protein
MEGKEKEDKKEGGERVTLWERWEEICTHTHTHIETAALILSILL